MKYLSGIFNKKRYGFMCLENTEDVETYTKVDQVLKSKQAISFWMGFKSQTFQRSPAGYLQHEVVENSIARVLALNMEIKRKETSIVDFCMDADSIIFDLHSRMFQYAVDGKAIRINQSGGVCPINDFKEYDEITDISEQQMLNFLLHKDINASLKINKKTIFLENDDYVPKKTITQFTKLTSIQKSEIQIINNLKHRTLLFNENDFVEFFANGIKHGLENIVFQTTAQDSHQIDNLKRVLEYVMSMFTENQLNIYVEIYDFKDIPKTKSPNIKIYHIKK